MSVPMVTLKHEEYKLGTNYWHQHRPLLFFSPNCFPNSMERSTNSEILKHNGHKLLTSNLNPLYTFGGGGENTTQKWLKCQLTPYLIKVVSLYFYRIIRPPPPPNVKFAAPCPYVKGYQIHQKVTLAKSVTYVLSATHHFT